MRQPLLDSRNFTAAFMSAPALVGLLLFVAVPFLFAVALSFTNLRLGSPLPLEWMGFEQYRRIFSDPSFVRALLNNLVFVVVVVPLQTVLALVLALLLNRRFYGTTWFRTLFFMPVVFPLSLVAVVWVLIFAPGPNGMMNAFLDLVSLGSWTPRDFLHDPYFALPAIMLTSIWQGTGFQMVILLAGLQAVPAELYEAAAIDGAGRRQQFWHITLPQLRNTLIFVVLVTTILAFRLFDQVQIMTQGGPYDASTTVMFETVEAAFARQQVARGAAMTVILFLVVLLITWLQRRVARQEREVT
ncbi:MAG: sugar ABC transporter permease [Candidatus Thiodiazotropha lotti]|uniref:Sugar ABC transporter permease n=1 Tax=Candidatus Thiodiazotropha lotti TaxID=2792787 RepID=A0A9E4MYV7_9GAMM|nr:sugar ABC transporter permease [Candidatus Thiodiazotropha lotti]MCG7937563.1 sugar ABC transporter permease [Candidatus Thiodiazotropha lotti]MCG8003969.1 sugar ABC transporter permease [Candidatus Thiodiazotropha lotti]MCG8009919.1 sugar ABC transporter permease [Candidatus Thiodiazotropha lotti]MCG8013780.1 sugar ABC transporter permease [Candidatus Thiodiazotropha lotti]